MIHCKNELRWCKFRINSSIRPPYVSGVVYLNRDSSIQPPNIKVIIQILKYKPRSFYSRISWFQKEPVWFVFLVSFASPHKLIVQTCFDTETHLGVASLARLFACEETTLFKKINNNFGFFAKEDRSQFTMERHNGGQILQKSTVDDCVLDKTF